MLSRQTDETKGTQQLGRLVAAAGALLMLVVALSAWAGGQAAGGGSWLSDLSRQLIAVLPAGLRATLIAQAQVMGLPLAADSQAYWFMARAGGIIAYVLLWLATCWGILMSSKAIKGVVDVPVAFALHEFLPILAVGFATLHAVVLLGDSYIGFKPWQILVPFASPYEPFWTGLGTLALYLLIALIASFYVRKRIGQKAWRALHYASYVAFLMALLHGIMAGSDTGTPAMTILYWVTAGLSVFLIYYRLLAYAPKRPRTNSPVRPPTAES